MSLLRFDAIRLEFGEQVILRDADLSIEPGERICLIGRNGAGKSSTLKLITGELEADHGEITCKTGLVISQLRQTLPEALDQPVRDVIRSGLQATEQLLAEYEAMSARELDKHGLAELEKLQSRIDSLDGWHVDQRVEATISDLRLPAEKRMNELSGGWRRRVALAQALVQKPDLLLLDEPTNHLDIATIKWLEDRVYNYAGAVLFITHDRAFLQRIATRIVEIDRGKTLKLPFGDDVFDAVTVGFGIRNVTDLGAGIREMARVAKPGGRVAILEFTRPSNLLFRFVYYVYFLIVLPIIGNLVSGGRQNAYGYLPRSVLTFPDRHRLARVCEENGLADVRVHSRTLGIVTVHVGNKPGGA